MSSSINESIVKFKSAMSNFATGVCVITSYNNEGSNIKGITINSLSKMIRALPTDTMNSVSLNPTLLSFNLCKRAREFKTFFNAEYFCVNVLNASQENVSELFAFEDYSKFDDYKVKKLDTDTCANFILINNVVAAFYCKKYACYEAGDHYIILGEVLESEVLDCEKDALGYFRSDYITIK